MSGKKVTGFKPGSKSWKNFMAKLYGIGAAVVIVGALFKIMHWPLASEFLIIGLSTEAVIFFFSAFEPLHEDPDWSLVYPELAAIDDEELLSSGIIEDDHHQPSARLEGNQSLTSQLDEMLEEAKIGPELIESLGSGLRGLSDQASKLSKIADVSVANQEFSDNLKNASTKVSELGASYSKAAEAINDVAGMSQNGASYGEELKRMSQNLSELNSMYELQLQGTSSNLDSANKLSEGIQSLMQNLNDSVSHTESYKHNIQELSDNLAALNTVYGNMLTAMNVTKG